MSHETAKLYESMSDDDIAWAWNNGKEIDDDGTLEDEVRSRGFKDIFRPDGKRRNRRLRADDKDGWSAFFSENAPP